MEILADLPDWLFGLAVLSAAAACAYTLHWVLTRFLLKLARFGRIRSFVEGLVTATSLPSRLILVVLALLAALPFARLPEPAGNWLSDGLRVVLILLAGWGITRGLEVIAALYMRRFRIDEEDNRQARAHLTQIRLLKRAGDVLIGMLTVATALTTFEAVRGYGTSLFASAGVASVLIGLAARPLMTNLIAGVQIALTQPIRLEDAVIVEGEWGWIEEITATYVVVRLWDWRRMVLPLTYFLEKPFQNWTRDTTSLIGSIFLHVDYTVSVEAIRQELTRIVQACPLWDKQVVTLQVTEARENSVELRALVSARNAPQAWDLRCEVREKLIAFLQTEHPEALPVARIELRRPADSASTFPEKNG